MKELPAFARVQEMKGPITMNDTSMKPQMLTLLHFARQQELAMVEELSETERNTQGTPEKWAAKDFLANILRWKQLQTQKLATAQKGEVPPPVSARYGAGSPDR